MALSPQRLAEFQNVQDRLHVRVLACGYLQIGRSWNVRDVRSPFWRLYRNEDAGAGVDVDGGYYPLPPGRVHLIPPWVRFSCRCRSIVRHLYVHFDLVGLTGAASRQSFDRPRTLATDAMLDRLCDLLATSISSRERDAVLACMIKSLVYLALRPVLAATPPPPVGGDARTALIWQTVRHIEAHLHTPLDTPSLAELCDLSTDHFARVFRDVVGQSPARYVAERRVARAAQDLLSSDASIEDIAEQTGFANRFHFTRLFTRMMGTPPAAYRKLARV